jgi:Zn-dependent peptidase ImmA (M78 family)
MARRPNRAEQAAIALLERSGVTAPPVPVERIARQLGIELRYEPLAGDLSGALYRAADGRTVIGINDWHAEVRQRFTIAHELGHQQLHPDVLYVDGLVKRDGESSLAINAHEVEANAFAAELLMPRQLVLNELELLVPQSGSPEPKRLIRRLAQRFEVSDQAMQFRLVNLGLATSF